MVAAATTSFAFAAAASATAAAAVRLSGRAGRVQTNRWASFNGGNASSSHTSPQACSSAVFGPCRG